MAKKEPDWVDQGAVFSPCRTYRYRLWREVEPSEDQPRGTCTFLMLNPSTADENVFDPTVRRCWGYASDWGYRRLEILNLFALRSTDPKLLYEHGMPVGPDNDAHIVLVADASSLLVCAWGNHGGHRGRSDQVRHLLLGSGVEANYLKMTKLGEPGHPLYLRKDLKPQTMDLHGRLLVSE